MEKTMHKISRTHGFTLIELVIVIAIVGIIASFAYPSYQENVNSGRRTDAINSLLQLQMLQEKWRANNTSYTGVLNGSNCNTLTVTGLCWNGTNSAEGLYTVSITASSATGYLLQASPRAGTAQAGDRCGDFYVNQDGPDYTPGGAADAQCWKRG